jgi:hypothetical protein
MVRAILEGRKTQTRRVMKPQPVQQTGWVGGAYWERRPARGIVPADQWSIAGVLRFCPYGQRGDRLWVRETCRADELDSGLDGVRYPADGAFRAIADSSEAAARWVEMYAYRGQTGATVPAIHMPRWASRITLEITSVRAERLQNISESDARDEGVTIADHHMRGYCAGAYLPPSIRAFHDLWDSLNAARGHGWDTNPWVWVVEFRRIES